MKLGITKKYDSTDDTIAHINKVQANVSLFTNELTQQILTHDNTKLLPPEKELFDKYTPILKDLTYGSQEYKDALTALKPALDNHYASHRHHPEHFENGMAGMTLVDLVEMFCDWIASCTRHDNGNPFDSIVINKERFGYDDVMAQILANTVTKLFPELATKCGTYEEAVLRKEEKSKK